MNQLQTVSHSPAAPFDALRQLAGFHLGRPEVPALLRKHPVISGGRAFPMPEDVLPLLILLFERQTALLRECTHPLDDLRVAGYVSMRLLEIRPFPDGNGRTAIDYAHLLIMRRWQREEPVAPLPADHHRVVGALARGPRLSQTQTSGRGLVLLAKELGMRIRDAVLESLRNDASTALAAATIFHVRPHALLPQKTVGGAWSGPPPR